MMILMDPNGHWIKDERVLITKTTFHICSLTQEKNYQCVIKEKKTY